MSQSVDGEVVEVLFSEVQPKTAFEVSDSSFEFVPAQGSD